MQLISGRLWNEVMDLEAWSWIKYLTETSCLRKNPTSQTIYISKTHSDSEGNIEVGLPSNTASKKEELKCRQIVSNISCEHEHSSFWKGYQTRHLSSIAGILLTKEAMQKIFLNCYSPSEESPALQAMSSALSSWVCFLIIDTASLVCHYLRAYTLPWGE